ncbi:hypothetical protein [Methanobrevibacter sp.]
MKIKLAILFGILIWIFTNVFISIINAIFGDKIIPITIVIPIIIIILITFFGTLYIRNFNSNEVLEGLTCGIIFVLTDIVLDNIFFVIPQVKTILIENYPLHIFFMAVMTILITTFLGYLAQMNIDLK